MMMKILFIFVVPLIAFSHGEPTEDEFNENLRIVGGSSALPEEAKYQVSLRTNTNAHFCSGSMISYRTIITAAHCIADRAPENIIIVAATKTLNANGRRYVVGIVSIHPDYDAITRSNDIGVLIAGPISLGPNSSHIQLGTSEIGGGVPVTVTGWGTNVYPGSTMTNELQTLPSKTITSEECKAALSDMILIKDTQICTFTKSGEGVCRGDSGGPLVYNNTLIGIVSWGSPCAKGVPDVFVRISSYISWINENTQ